jgi:hypothetical protein
MLTTIKAEVDVNGDVKLLEPLHLKKKRRAILTVLDEEVVPNGNALEKDSGSIRELFGSVDLGRPTGADNESIDADLTKEYSNTHDKD